MSITLTQLEKHIKQGIQVFGWIDYSVYYFQFLSSVQNMVHECYSTSDNTMFSNKLNKLGKHSCQNWSQGRNIFEEKLKEKKIEKETLEFILWINCLCYFRHLQKVQNMVLSCHSTCDFKFLFSDNICKECHEPVILVNIEVWKKNVKRGHWSKK